MAFLLQSRFFRRPLFVAEVLLQFFFAPGVVAFVVAVELVVENILGYPEHFASLELLWQLLAWLYLIFAVDCGVTS